MQARWLGRQPGRIEAIVAAHEAVMVASQDGTVALWPLDVIGCSDALYRWTAKAAPRAIFEQVVGLDLATVADDDDHDGDDDELAMFPSYAEFYDVGGKTAIHALAFHGDRLIAGLEDGSIVELTVPAC